ncbi:septal ring lytic transglycosylase RlpA family protein [Azospirillum argentinense]|uniref:Endolytic peptidoglycan transglycosylase RlpA n=2 Tax=Azospirillum TaxID=191 RepID=A0A4D8PVA5_AZOBR|nr:septal ring lytic transglycosylase RlpA family protein [Azospirillum argentinense]PNR00884.1 septal ring lytic transglycosylase RlpA family protein [Azospirillum argentinense]QCO01421.1 septal ring lytic transglycosylase RlpA family protein [Azospirillum argentinense]
MRRAHMLRGAVVLAGALTLAACASAPPAPSSSGLPRSGVYKVGKPYQVNGVWYYPAEDYSYSETGIASWYGPGFHQKVTANGEVYDQNELTAAHKTLPMPSLVRVTNLDNGRSLVVRINDRGPYANGRIIDMSRRGAQLLGFEGTGTAKVRVQILAEESRAVAAAARQGTPAPMLAELDGPPPKAAPRGSVEVNGTARPTPAAVTRAPVPPPTTVAGDMVDGRFVPAPVVAELPVKPYEQIYVQVGAFGSPDNVTRVRARLASLGQQAQVTQTVAGRQRLQRVRVGPLASVDSADAVLNQIIQAGLTDAKIVVD